MMLLTDATAGARAVLESDSDACPIKQHLMVIVEIYTYMCMTTCTVFLSIILVV